MKERCLPQEEARMSQEGSATTANNVPLPLPSLKMDNGHVTEKVGRKRCQQRAQRCKAFLEWCRKQEKRIRGRTGVIRLGPNSGDRALAEFNLFLDMTLRHSSCFHFTGPVRVCKD